LLLRQSRRLVVATRGWPLLGSTYRGVYRLQVARLRRGLRGDAALQQVLLRGSTRGGMQPGLSDIDLVILLESGLTPEVELRAVERLGRVVRRVNLGAPLVHDLHIVAGDELLQWGRLGMALHAAFQVDTTPLIGDGVVPSSDLPPKLAKESLLRELCYRVEQGMRQITWEGAEVGRLLAGKSFAKADLVVRALEAGTTDLCAVRRAFRAMGKISAADWEACVRMLSTLDRLLPDAPEVGPEPRIEHAGISRVAPEIDRWCDPLRRLPAISAIVLSVEGACESDLRLYVAVDPGHARAADALRQIAERSARMPLRPPGPGSPTPALRVVTGRQLARTVLQRWTAFEPIARLRHGWVLHGDPPRPRASQGELERSLANCLARAGHEARELVRRPEQPGATHRWLDLACGIAPMARDCLAGRPVRTAHDRSVALHPIDGPAGPTLGRESQLRAFEVIRDATRSLLPSLVARATGEGRGDSPPPAR